MSGSSSEFNSPIRKAFLKPFKPINKKIGEATGKVESGGAVALKKASKKINKNYGIY